ncbi:MAG: homoserine O-succinyltransferase [Ruminococcaceae bacterium]|nr:homoserine O-succinyltransferase [Oscillospiraceae bacterium]
MPVKIPSGLPAYDILAKENIFVMDQNRAETQDIRPLDIALLNLMPTKKATETQLMRLLGNSPLQVNMTLITTASYSPRNVEKEYLDAFYKTFDELKHRQFDGLVVTGAPIEHLEFEDVVYWKELVEIMDWAKENVYSTFFICWGAQAALYHYYGVKKVPLKKKLFGVFPHKVLDPLNKLMRGFDDIFYAPHSRHTTVTLESVSAVPELDILSVSDEAGFYLAASKDSRSVFSTGHSEYDALTLDTEYKRDLNLGLKIEMPINYYPDNNPEKTPAVTWRSHANILYTNWLNYFVYQETPYDISKIKHL